jgi:hypothetical protein
MEQTSLPPRRMLRRLEAARHVTETSGVPLSPKTLAKYAVVGGGPPFRKAGRIPLYDPTDLDTWVCSKLSRLVASTSELAELDRDQTPIADGDLQAATSSYRAEAGMTAPQRSTSEGDASAAQRGRRVVPRKSASPPV